MCNTFYVCDSVQSISFGSELSCVLMEEDGLSFGGSIDCKCTQTVVFLDARMMIKPSHILTCKRIL